MSWWLLCFIGLFSWLHPVHVSVTNIEYKENQGVFELSFKVFSDDFQLLMEHMEGWEPGNHENTMIIDRYFNEVFSIAVNEQKPLVLSFTGSKQNEEATWYFYRSQPVAQVRQVEIKNQILLHLYGDQTNLVIFKMGDFDNGYRLNIRKSEISFTVNE